MDKAFPREAAYSVQKALKSLFGDKCLLYIESKTKDMKEKELNLCEILKGHEGETFYSVALGKVKLHKISEEDITLIPSKQNSIGFRCSISDAEQDLFPSKDQRDWLKWDKENNHKIPKIWDEIIYSNPTLKGLDYSIDLTGANYDWTRRNTSIEKSALALLKIHQLIEVGYGGNITDDDWNYVEYKYVIGCYSDTKEFKIVNTYHYKSLIAFHTGLQAEEFLSYPENVQLLKDYFQIN